MFKLLIIILIIITFSSCSQKVEYVEKDKAGIKIPLITNQVLYKTYKSFDIQPPTCVAVLPFDLEKQFKLHKNVYLEPSAVVRRSVFSHLSPLTYRDIELVMIDKLFNELTKEGKIDYKYIGEQLNCDSVLTGTVTNFDSYDLKIYSNLIIGVKLKLYRTSDTALLWEGEHKAESKGGTIPLSPIGVAVGMINAARNMIEEQYLRLSDDLSRRLMKVFPYSANINFDETLIANLDKKRIQNSLSDPDKTKEPIRTKTESFDRIQEIRAQLNDENILLKDNLVSTEISDSFEDKEYIDSTFKKIEHSIEEVASELSEQEVQDIYQIYEILEVNEEEIIEQITRDLLKEEETEKKLKLLLTTGLIPAGLLAFILNASLPKK